MSRFTIKRINGEEPTFQPEAGELYFYASENATFIKSDTWTNDQTDRVRLSAGNVFVAFESALDYVSASLSLRGKVRVRN